MMENINLAGYDLPTSVQMYIIPVVLKDYDVVAVTQISEDLHVRRGTYVCRLDLMASVQSPKTPSIRKGKAKRFTFLKPDPTATRSDMGKLVVNATGTGHGWQNKEAHSTKARSDCHGTKDKKLITTTVRFVSSTCMHSTKLVTHITVACSIHAWKGHRLPSISKTFT